MNPLDQSTPTDNPLVGEPVKSIFDKLSEKPDGLTDIREKALAFMKPISSIEDLTKAILIMEEMYLPAKSKSLFISVENLEFRLKKAKAYCNHEGDEDDYI